MLLLDLALTDHERNRRSAFVLRSELRGAPDLIRNEEVVIRDEEGRFFTGSVIDTREGAVRLQSRGSGGKIETGVFSDGLFRVTQTKQRRPVTVLTLVEKLSCPKATGAQAAATRKKRRKRRLWGDAHGDYRTRGLYGSAVNTGTKWMTEDSCAGTLFRVTRGVIRVTPNGSRRTLTVRAGHQYLVRRKP